MRLPPPAANRYTDPGLTRASLDTLALISYIPTWLLAANVGGVWSCTCTSQPPSANTAAAPVNTFQFDMPPPILSDSRTASLIQLVDRRGLVCQVRTVCQVRVTRPAAVRGGHKRRAGLTACVGGVRPSKTSGVSVSRLTSS